MNINDVVDSIDKEQINFKVHDVKKEYKINLIRERIELSLVKLVDSPYIHVLEKIYDSGSNEIKMEKLYNPIKNPERIFAALKETYDQRFEKEYFNNAMS